MDSLYNTLFAKQSVGITKDGRVNWIYPAVCLTRCPKGFPALFTVQIYLFGFDNPVPEPSGAVVVISTDEDLRNPEFVPGRRLALMIRAVKGHVRHHAGLQVRAVGLRAVDHNFVNVLTSLESDQSFLDRLDRLVFVGSLNGRIDMQSNHQEVASLFAFCEKQNVSSVEKVERAAGESFYHWCHP